MLPDEKALTDPLHGKGEIRQALRTLRSVFVGVDGGHHLVGQKLEITETVLCRGTLEFTDQIADRRIFAVSSEQLGQCGRIGEAQRHDCDAVDHLRPGTSIHVGVPGELRHEGCRASRPESRVDVAKRV